MSTIKILTCRSCSVSARLLADSIAALVPSHRILVTRDASKIRPRGRYVRYGNADPTRGANETAFNSAAFIRLVADKGAFAARMAEHEIYSPVYHTSGAPTSYPAVIRKTLTASNAIGMVMCADAAAFTAAWRPGYVWTPFVKTSFELRVHVLGGKIVKLFKKIRVTPDGQTPTPEVAMPIRNLDNGYHYQARDLEPYEKVQELVDDLHPILGGAFYTLDIGWDKKTKRYFVFEANSGSGLNTQTVELYAQYLVDELNQTT